MATSISLADDQWIEIYYALDTKAHLAKEGFSALSKRGAITSALSKTSGRS